MLLYVVFCTLNLFVSVLLPVANRCAKILSNRHVTQSGTTAQRRFCGGRGVKLQLFCTCVSAPLAVLGTRINATKRKRDYKKRQGWAAVSTVSRDRAAAQLRGARLRGCRRARLYCRVVGSVTRRPWGLFFHRLKSYLLGVATYMPMCFSISGYTRR